MLTRILHWTAGTAILVGAFHYASAQQPDAQTQARDIAVKVCSACHGPGGDSTNPMFPKLAAQLPLYLESQLNAFRAHQRAEPEAQHFMWGAASRSINERLIGEVAKYYAAQPAPKAQRGDPELVAKGRQLYQEGSTAREIPACASCHGADGHGMSLFPRLAAQHKEYLLKQLRLIQTAIRNAPVMHGVIEHLSDADMQATATYLQSLD